MREPLLWFEYLDLTPAQRKRGHYEAREVPKRTAPARTGLRHRRPNGMARRLRRVA